MRYFVVAVGKARAPYLDDLQHYEKLLSRYARVDVIEVADDEALRAPDPGARVRLPARQPRARVRAPRRSRLARGAPPGGPRRVLRDRRRRSGPSSHGATTQLSFGPVTLPHLLARVVLLEQLYRAHKILAGRALPSLRCMTHSTS